ncbi:hypothetical protein DFH09DRAFT_1165719 [Mycena vulgaris]|nr:hypothetical protein DFH09DRAFT_1165719 [Mycena vulgaris]
MMSGRRSNSIALQVAAHNHPNVAEQQRPSSETVQFMRLPAKEKPNSVVIAEPVVAQIISAQPNFPLPMENPLEPTYEIHATGNMGLGMFAKRALKAGDLVLSERPALVYPNRFRSTSEELEAAFGVALDEMRVQDRIAYRKLAKGPDRLSAAGDLIRIATANCFQLPPNLPGGPNKQWSVGDYRGVYLEASRINHSCSPNTVADFDFPTFSFVVRAVRDIKEGEEISTRYCGLEAPKAYRRNLLHFCMDSCGCSVCTNPPDGSDQRRMAIATYTPSTLATHLSASIDAPEKLLADMLQCVQMYVDEELQSMLTYPMLLDISGRLAGMVGKKELADKQKRDAEMFYQMRSWYTRDRNFVKWVFEPAEGMAERLHWAVSHLEEFEHMLSEW